MIAALAMVVAACGASDGSTQTSKSTFTVANDGEPTSLNPDVVNDATAYSINANIYNTLVNVNEVTGELQPQLAKSWDVSADGSTYTFHLDDRVKWHDGVPLTASDVKYTYDTIVANSLPFASYLKGVTFTVSDPHTLVATLAAKNNSWLPLMAMAGNWFGYILPEHLYKGTDWKSNEHNQAPIGSGPYRFASWSKGSEIRLSANTSYFLGAPKTKNIVFKFISNSQVAIAALQAGQLDSVPYSYLDNFQKIKAIKEQKDGPIRYVDSPIWYDRCVYFNMKSKPLGDVRVRRALAMALNRDQISSLALAGLWPTVNHAAIDESVTDKSAAFPSFDLAGAKQLLDEAGYARHGDSPRFTLTFVTYPLGELTAMAPVIVRQWQQLGIDVEWKQYDRATFYAQIKSGNYDVVAYYVRYGPTPSAIGLSLGTGAINNYSHYSNSEFDQLITKLDQTDSKPAVQDLYDQVQTILAKDMPYVPIVRAILGEYLARGWSGTPFDNQTKYGWFSYYGVQHDG